MTDLLQGPASCKNRPAEWCATQSGAYQSRGQFFQFYGNLMGKIAS